MWSNIWLTSHVKRCSRLKSSYSFLSLTNCWNTHTTHHHHHHYHVASEGRRVVAPPCPWSTARIQRSPTGQVECFIAGRATCSMDNQVWSGGLRCKNVNKSLSQHCHKARSSSPFGQYSANSELMCTVIDGTRITYLPQHSFPLPVFTSAPYDPWV